MELLRIVAMLMILFVHANYLSLGEVTPDDLCVSPVNSLVRIILEQLCVVCVNVFVLISGWFGIKPSVKGALSLLYQVFFFSVVIIFLMQILGIPIQKDLMIKPFLFGISYCFVPAYLILYAFSPVLNTFVDNASPKQQLSVLISFFLLEFIYGWATDSANFGNGYSAISFIGLYLLARFLRLHAHRITQLKLRSYLLFYLLVTFIPICIYYFTGCAFNILAYTSPFVILGSVCLLLGFSRLRIESAMINRLACSSFSIYLVHQHPLVVPCFIDSMQSAYRMLGGTLYIVFVIVFAVVLGCLCIMLDKLRIISWKWICNSSFLFPIIK